MGVAAYRYHVLSDECFVREVLCEARLIGIFLDEQCAFWVPIPSHVGDRSNRSKRKK
jgi:hypothetical protein